MNYQPYINHPTYGYSQPNNGILWVQGIEGAKAFQLMPNSNAVLLDSENDGVFYIKLSDNVGMCTLRTFEYIETTNDPPKNNGVDLSSYVTKSEFEKAINEIKEVIKNEQFVSAVKPKQN